jgi:hypothetical protein
MENKAELIDNVAENAASANGENVKITISTLGKAVRGVGSAIGQSITSKLEGTETGQKALWVGGKTADALKSGVQAVAEATGKVTDNLSGAEVHERILEFVDQQRRYNDILATRLAEALARIEQLERINAPKPK